MGAAIVGSDATVQAGIKKLVQESGADELIVVTDTFDPEARLQSYERVARIASTIEVKSAAHVSA